MENWREFLGGGNDIWFFLKKGNHPHRAEHEDQSRKSRADKGRKEGRAGSREQKADGRQSRRKTEQTAEQGAGRKQKVESKK